MLQSKQEILKLPEILKTQNKMAGIEKRELNSTGHFGNTYKNRCDEANLLGSQVD